MQEPAAENSSAGRAFASSERPLRADARRNRDRLVQAATRVLADGSGAVSLEAIAREAGVGIGTLYRHFPTRDALIEAIYASELDALLDDAESLRRQLPADQALREWMTRHAQFAATKHGMLDALRAGLSGSGPSPSRTRQRVTEAVDLLLRGGVEDGSLRADVEPDDVAVMLLGVFLVTARTGSPGQEGRLHDLMLDALRKQ